MLLLVGPCSHFMKGKNKSTFSIFFPKEIEHNGHTRFAHPQILENELNDLCNVLIQIPWFCPSLMESYHTEHFNALLWHVLFPDTNSSPEAQVHSAGREQDKMFQTGEAKGSTLSQSAYHKGNFGIVSLPKSFREQKEIHRHVLCKISFFCTTVWASTT